MFFVFCFCTLKDKMEDSYFFVTVRSFFPIGLDQFEHKIVFCNFSSSVLTYVLGTQKNRLIEMVLLSTHNICFDLEIRN